MTKRIWCVTPKSPTLCLQLSHAQDICSLRTLLTAAGPLAGTNPALFPVCAAAWSTTGKASKSYYSALLAMARFVASRLGSLVFAFLLILVLQ
ncbi:predicted protein [Plenodomus lingam JN3]|uniref:Predicted protein n=1 Tax=Leptosphaeria maculans (strain JN3 / isolate v23.1.3 / race Av1-4-5-6-7-8) TaxID=985895 RepID=E5ACU4_LEPMJ|nr:predicted protein [Plenodomus lingam JN3]CBY02296.1 predicted protein [Plenodomus lingam JN3]